MSQTFLLSAGDLYFNAAGKPEMISGIDKAAQDISIALLQVFDAEQDFGSELAALQTPQFGNSLGALQGLIGQKVLQAIDRLIQLQSLDLNKIGADELIDEIRSIKVEQLGDLLSFRFLLDVRVASGDSTLKAMQLNLSHQLPSSYTNPPGTAR